MKMQHNCFAEEKGSFGKRIKVSKIRKLLMRAFIILDRNLICLTILRSSVFFVFGFWSSLQYLDSIIIQLPHFWSQFLMRVFEFANEPQYTRAWFRHTRPFL